jgi:hypothetical protein
MWHWLRGVIRRQHERPAGRWPAVPNRTRRAAKVLLQALEERTVPTVSLFDASNTFVRNYSGADAVQQAINSNISAAHIVVYNDESYSGFTAGVDGQTILGRDVNTTYATFPFQADVNVLALGSAVAPQPTINGSGAGTTITVAGNGAAIDNLNIVDGPASTADAVQVTGNNFSITNSTIQMHNRGVFVDAAVSGLVIANNTISTTDTALELSGSMSATVTGNTITSSAGDGLHDASGGTGGLTIQGNTITGGLYGVELLDSAGAIVIGGALAGQGNTITAGPNNSAIFAGWITLFGSAVTVQGNTILGGSVGIDVFNDERGAILIGGDAPAAGNTVTGTDTGIFVRVSIGGLTIQNNVVTDIGTYGIRLSGTGLTPSFNGGIGSTNPFLVLDNVVSSTSGDTGLLMDDGIYDQYHYYDVGTAKNNTISGFATGVSIENQGDVTLDNLTVTDASTGINLDGGDGSVELLHVSVISGDYTVRDRGVYANGNGYGSYYHGLYVTSLSISNVTITASADDSIGVDLEKTASGTLQNVAINLPSTPGNTSTGVLANGSELVLDDGNSIISGHTGIQINDLQYYPANLLGNTLSDISFSGQTGDYVDIDGGALAGAEIDATHASFDGLVGATAPVATPTDLAAVYTVSGKIDDALNTPGVGFVRLKAGYVFVGQGDELSTAGAIQRGIDAAGAGDTLEVQAGSYTGDLNVNKPLTLLGAQADVDPVPGRAGAETIVTGAGVNGPIQIASGTDAVDINGFTVQSPAGGSGSLNAGIWTDGSTGVTIEYDIIQNNTSGVAVGDSSVTIAQNVITNNNQGGAGGTGVAVTAGGSATLLENAITDNAIGVLVDAATALLQGNDLRNNTTDGPASAGLLIKNGAVVDAGQDNPATPAVEGANFTGLGISQGGNLFNWAAIPAGGYSQTGAQAIVNDNAYAGPLPGDGSPAQPPNLPAQYNDFGASTFARIEQIVFHNSDDPTKAVVDYRNAVGAIAVAPIPDLYAVGSGPGSDPRVKVYNADGSLRFSFDAYSQTFTGGVFVAVADVNGDGVPDIITGAGAGGGPHVKVFSGVDGSQIDSFYAYAATFAGGVRVAAADLNGDGKADIVTGAGPGGGPHVEVFSGADLSVLASFYAYAPTFTGGVFVAAGDVNGDGHADVITGAGAGGGPHVEVFDGAALAAGGSAAQVAIDHPLRSFYAYAPAFTGGVSVAAGDVNGDGQADIITGAGAGGSPHLEVFSGADNSLLASFNAYSPAFKGGLTVAAADVNSDGQADIVTGGGLDGAAHVEVFNGADDSLLQSFDADPAFLGGVFVG